VCALGENRTVLTRSREGETPAGDHVEPDVTGEGLGGTVIPVKS
jgi:hypothetical protein